MADQDDLIQISNGDGLQAGFFNALGRVMGVDSGADTWANTDTTYTEIATVDCTSQPTGGWGVDYALIIVNVEASYYGDDTPDKATPYIEIKVGESGSEAQVAERKLGSMGNSTSIGTLTANQQVLYLHTLTAGEKSNGFNVIVNGKYAITGSGNSNTSTHYQTIVLGVSGV